MTFKSEKNIYTTSLLWAMVAFLSSLFFFPDSAFKGSVNKYYPLFFIVVPVIVLLVSVLVQTKYEITDTELLYRCGPFYGKIKIESIRNIEYDDKFVKNAALKFGLGRRGLIIHYGQFDDVFISPKARDLFVEELLKVNPNIKVKNESL